MALEEIIKEREKKLKKLRSFKVDPYPEHSQRSFPIKVAREKFNALSRSRKNIYLTGRLFGWREHGSLIFADLIDESGKIQLLFKKDQLKNNQFILFKECFDIGDFIQVKGTLFKTQAKEITLLVDDFKMLAKTLRPLPQKWYGLADEEERFRKRYLDLLMNPEVKKRFDLRIKIFRLIREFLVKAGYQEVETPILQTLYGGATARPFKTHLNALDIDLYLRIAPELYLKRLLVGGYEKIFEIGKNFRNEGLDREHNPEFTMLELYAAYESRDYLYHLIEKLMVYLGQALKEEIGLKNHRFSYGQKTITLKPPFARIPFDDFLKEKTGLDLEKSSLSDFKKKAKELGVLEEEDLNDKFKWADAIFKKLRAQLVEPVFIIDQPTALSPLAKQNPLAPQKTLRFYFIMAGWELMNGFSELNDPLEQKKRFKEQLALKKMGNVEAHPLDWDFIEALEYGLPPAAGLGIGLDRLVAILTNAPALKETLFFPLLRPKNKK